MHVQFFPVYVLTCGAHNSGPLWSFNLKLISFGSQYSLPTPSDL